MGEIDVGWDDWLLCGTGRGEVGASLATQLASADVKRLRVLEADVDVLVKEVAEWQELCLETQAAMGECQEQIDEKEKTIKAMQKRLNAALQMLEHAQPLLAKHGVFLETELASGRVGDAEPKVTTQLDQLRVALEAREEELRLLTSKLALSPDASMDESLSRSMLPSQLV